MNITLRQLTYFRALAEERHFGRAAQRVHVTQPALSMQIKEMEETLGLALVERLPRNLRLTPAGREVLVHAERVLAAVAGLEAAVRQTGLAGRINLGVIPTVAPYLVPAVLMQLRRGPGPAELRVREAQTEDLLAGLADGRLDAAVIAAPEGRDDLEIRPLFEDRFLLAGAAERIDRYDTEALRPRALDPAELLLLDEGHCLADQALEVCGLTRAGLRVDLGAASLATLCGLVAGDFGLTFLPEIALAAEAAAAPGLTVRRFAAPEPARRIVLARRAGGAADGDDWFGRMAAALAREGLARVTDARRAVPPDV